MKIDSTSFSRFRNNEHFQFHTEFRRLVANETAAKLKIAKQFEHYVACYDKEDISIQIIRKSATTDDIEVCSRLRNRTFRGLTLSNSAMLYHPDPQMMVAAKRLKILFDTYGNIARLPLNEATSAIYNLMQELQGDYASDVQKLSLSDWATMLKAQNANMEAFMKSRNNEKASRTDLKMVNTRLETDRAYDAIVSFINSSIIINGPTIYEPFVRKLNAFIGNYTQIIAQRRGRNHSSPAAKQQEAGDTPEA